MALVDHAGGPAKLLRVHADHLGTPQAMTDDLGTLVWERHQRPFGETASQTGTASNDRRFPGQLFDAESGYHYNYFRDYDPSIGRYLQSDPIGLAGGLNTYAYVGGNPINDYDPTGEAAALAFCFVPGVGWATCGGIFVAVAAMCALDAQERSSGGFSLPDIEIPDFFNSEEADDPSEESTEETNAEGNKPGKNEPHGDQKAMKKAKKKIEEIDAMIEELKKDPKNAKKIKELEKKKKNIRKIAEKNKKGETHHRK